MQIVDAVHNVLERTPPELAADVYDRGIVMTGGGSLLSGLDALIEEKTGINTVIAESRSQLWPSAQESSLNLCTDREIPNKQPYRAGKS